MIATLRLLILGSLSAAALPASAAVIHVGPGGTTLPLALNAALAPGDDEIRIATGEHSVNATFNNASADMLTISGGWDPTFTTRTDNPALTVLDGGASDRTFLSAAVPGGSKSTTSPCAMAARSLAQASRRISAAPWNCCLRSS